MITLRVLSGASFLDMIWYQISINHVMDAVVWPVLEAIDRHVDNALL